MDVRADVAVESARPASAKRGESLRKWAVRIAVGASIAYLVGLVVAGLLLRFVGESWWITTVGLYLPRLVLGLPLPFLAIALVALRARRWLWTQAAAAFVLVVPIMGFVLPWPHGADPSAPRIRVLSYNVNSTYGGVDALVDEVNRYAPDVVLFEEAAHGEVVGPRLRENYATFEVAGQFMIASRFPILSEAEPDRIPLNGQMRSPRYTQRVLDTPLGPIAFYIVHPISPREDFAALRGQGLRREIKTGRLFSGGAAPQIASNAALRTLQVESFSAAADRETIPVVIAGDTNLPGLSKIFGRYLSHYTDGFRAAGWGLGYTYPNDRKPWMRIDRILASDALRFVGFEVGTSSASDHLCVVADLQRR